MKKQYIIGLVVAVALVLVFYMLSAKSPEEQEKPAQISLSPKAITSAPIGLSTAAVDSTPIAATDEAKAEVEKLWPHLKKEQPNEASREKVKAEWKTFAAKYPNNIYIPAELKPTPTEAEAKIIKQQLDDVTAVVAQNAAMKSSDKGKAQTGAAPATMTEAQAREKGITPAQQNNFFSYKIKELESRVQLGEFSLTSSEMSSTQKAAMTKELVVWKKELDELIKVKAKVPKS